MKVTSAILLLSFLSLSVFSQTEETDTELKSDTTKVKFGGTEMIIVQNNDDTITVLTDSLDQDCDDDDSYDDFTYWSGLDFGFTGIYDYKTKPGEEEWFDITESRSASFSINVVEKKIRIIKHYLGINTGLGFTFQDYALSDTINLVQVNDSIFGGSSSPIKYDKNKLKTGYIKIPVLIEINTSKKKSNNFHIAVGAIGGWNYRSVLKQKYEVDGNKSKVKTRGDYNLNPWSLEATARVGYGDFTVFANASLTELFESGKGPEVYPFTVGVSILAF